MAKWTNWSGRISASPRAIVAVANDAQAAAVVERAAREGRSLRVQGARHSHAPLLPTDGLLVDTSALSGIVDVDRERREARIRAGTRISTLGAPLRAAGLALHNQGDIDRQALAGAVATGTHGTGVRLRNLSASVVGARLVLADGAAVECSADAEPELFQAARLSLGSLGIVTELRLSLRDAYRLEERMWLEDLEQVLERLDELVHATRHFEFFWRPGKPRVACKALAETSAPPRRPLGAEGSRLSWSDEVLANVREEKHTEMEYSVPLERGPACMRAIRERIDRDFPDLTWPVEYRTLAADDVWLSTAYRRPTATLSIHQGVDRDDGPLFAACEEIFREFEGRPHWGKIHGLGGAELRRLHERWDDWWRVRDGVDPDGIFLNDALRGWRDG